MRPGQQAFNDLYEADPSIADAIRGSDADPFYEDERLGKFYARIAELVRQRDEQQG